MMTVKNLLVILSVIVYCNAQAGLLQVPFSTVFNSDTFCVDMDDGNYQHPFKCTVFVACSGNVTYEINCPDALFYNARTNECDFPEKVECLQIQGETCYNAKDNGFGTISLKRGGALRQFSLESRSGFVSCDASNPAARSNWGCGVGFLSVKMGTVVTTVDNSLLFPSFALDENGYYFVARTDTFSRVLTLFNFRNERDVTKGQTIRIWHGEDLVNKNEENNSGTHCVRVWASFFQSEFS